MISERHLYEIYPRLLRFTRRQLRGDQAAAEEVLQTSVLMAIEYFKRTQIEPLSIEAWLKQRIVWNRDNYFKSLSRDKKRFGNQKTTHEEFDAEMTARPSAATETTYDIEEFEHIDHSLEDYRATLLDHQCFQRLKSREQEILEYSYGLKKDDHHNTIEIIFGISTKTKANILSQAKKQLFKCLKEWSKA